MKKIDDNTMLRISVPKALYESIKKQLEKKKRLSENLSDDPKIDRIASDAIKYNKDKTVQDAITWAKKEASKADGIKDQEKLEQLIQVIRNNFHKK